MSRPRLVNPAHEEHLEMQEEIKNKSYADTKRMYEFYNTEEPGMMLKFTYGSSKNPKRYELFHGGKYELTEDVVRHLESKQTPIWAWRPSGDGRMAKSLTGWKPRFQLREVRS